MTDTRPARPRPRPHSPYGSLEALAAALGGRPMAQPGVIVVARADAPLRLVDAYKPDSAYLVPDDHVTDQALADVRAYMAAAHDDHVAGLEALRDAVGRRPHA